MVVSGRKPEGQKHFRALLDEVRDGDTVTVDHLSRLGRTIEVHRCRPDPSQLAADRVAWQIDVC